jgi:pilus assembly protein Flp/PilA
MKASSMSNLADRIRKFVASEDGPTAVEYAIMLALILMACFTVVTTLGTNVSKNFSMATGGFGS